MEKNEDPMATISNYPLLQFLTPSLLVLSISTGVVDCRNQNHQETIAPSIFSSGIPPIPDSLRQKVNRYQNWRSATLVDWSPDGRSMLVLRPAERRSR
jgi:hypothetical protein